MSITLAMLALVLILITLAAYSTMLALVLILITLAAYSTMHEQQQRCHLVI